MSSTKQNCWEHMKCGREPGGDKVAELGLCRVAIDKSLNGLNSGINGGRICFAIAGTFCGGEVECLFAKELGSCTKCEFYKLL